MQLPDDGEAGSNPGRPDSRHYFLLADNPEVIAQSFESTSRVRALLWPFPPDLSGVATLRRVANERPYHWDLEVKFQRELEDSRVVARRDDASKIAGIDHLSRCRVNFTA